MQTHTTCKLKINLFRNKKKIPGFVTGGVAKLIQYLPHVYEALV